jgi:lambda family phage portal protein
MKLSERIGKILTPLLGTKGGAAVSGPSFEEGYNAGMRNAVALSTRRYSGGVTNRLNSDWRPSDTSADQDIYESLSTLRAKARDLTNNTELGKKFVRMVRKNIPGPFGFKLRMKVTKPNGEPDEMANVSIREAHEDWTKARHYTVQGNASARQVDHLLATHLVRDGEILARLVTAKSNKYGMAVQVLEPDLLDHTYNAKLPNGNHVILGVEVDSFRRPVAYYLRTSLTPVEYGGTSIAGKHERISAAEIIHWYDKERAFQTRGVPWLASTMLRLRMLSAMEEAALFAARVAASKMGFLSTPPNTTGMAGEAPYMGTGKDSAGNIVSGFEPGSIEDIGNKQFTPFDPSYPSQAHEPFTKAIGREIASGLDVSYHALFSDLTDVNYSSIRQGTLDERETWLMFQEDYIEAVKEPIFAAWLGMAMLSGAVSVGSMRDFDRYNKPYFIGRRWDWVDPRNDAQARLLMLRAKIVSLSGTILERGDDPEEIFRECAEDAKLAAKYGLKLDYGEPPEPTPAAQDGPNNSNNAENK